MALQVNYTHNDGTEYATCYVQVRAVTVNKDGSGVIAVFYWKDAIAAAGGFYQPVTGGSFVAPPGTITAAAVNAAGGLFAWAYNWLAANFFAGAQSV